MWFDHEEGRGGWFTDLVGRDLGMTREDATDWIGDRVGMGARHSVLAKFKVGRAYVETKPANPDQPDIRQGESGTTKEHDRSADPASSRAEDAAARATRIWDSARPAPKDHPYLAAKRAAPLALRMDGRGRLVVPLQDVDGWIHSLEFIAPDGGQALPVRRREEGALRGGRCRARPARGAWRSAPDLRGLGHRGDPAHRHRPYRDRGDGRGQPDAGGRSPEGPLPRGRSRSRRRQ
ncbi:hypothetical protein ACFOHS_22525 [Jhaorihella thermophila]